MIFNSEDRASRISKLWFIVRSSIVYYFSFKKKFEYIGSKPIVWNIWNIVVYGPNIRIGKNVTIFGSDGFKTNLTTLSIGSNHGSITIGDNVLVMNGARISSVSGIIIGDGCMLASHCYIMDSDWHDIHNRNMVPGKAAPVVLERGVWVGDSAIICKGVRIGENSIIGAGSVVRKDVPPNVVVTGNPARVVKKLDPEKIVIMGSI